MAKYRIIKNNLGWVSERKTIFGWVKAFPEYLADHTQKPEEAEDLLKERLLRRFGYGEVAKELHLNERGEEIK